MSKQPQQAECKVPGVPREPVFLGDYSFNTGTVKRFTSLDFFLFLATLATSITIGFFNVWRNRRQKTINDFLLAGRSMNAFPVGLSLLASFMSAITMMGTPTEIYNHSTMIVWLGLTYMCVVAIAAQVYMPVFYRLSVTSAYEYLEKRFNRLIRTAAACLFILQMLMYMSVVLYAPSLAVYAVTGFSLWGSILSIGVVCTVYTALGGMRAVIWTDSFQISMMITGLLILLIRAAITVGSFSSTWESALRSNRVLLTEFGLDPTIRHSVWGIWLGGFCTWVSLYGVNQAQVHRCLTCRTLEQAKIAMWMNFPGLCIMLYLCIAIGVYMSAFYENCDPSKADLIHSKDQLTLLFVMDILSGTVGLPGVFLAALFCGALSTISSGLNSIAAVVLEDFIRIFTKAYIKEGRARVISQVISFLFGVICLELTYLVSKMGDIRQAALSVNGGLSSPLLGVFSLGMFFPWANTKGAICGLFVSLCCNVWLLSGRNLYKFPPDHAAMKCVSNCNVSAFSNTSLASLAKPDTIITADPNVTSLYNISYLWVSPLGVLMCIIVGLVVSYITGLQDPKDVDPKLIVPLLDEVFPFYYLPESIREPLRFGIDHAAKWEVSSIRAKSTSTHPNKSVSTLYTLQHSDVPSWSGAAFSDGGPPIETEI